jgi:hypothetical protein
MKPGTSKEDWDIIKNGLETFIDSDLTQIIDTRDIVNSTSQALSLLTLFFNIGKIIQSIM